MTAERGLDFGGGYGQFRIAQIHIQFLFGQLLRPSGDTARNQEQRSSTCQTLKSQTNGAKVYLAFLFSLFLGHIGFLTCLLHLLPGHVTAERGLDLGGRMGQILNRRQPVNRCNYSQHKVERVPESFSMFSKLMVSIFVRLLCGMFLFVCLEGITGPTAVCQLCVC